MHAMVKQEDKIAKSMKLMKAFHEDFMNKYRDWDREILPRNYANENRGNIGGNDLFSNSLINKKYHPVRTQRSSLDSALLL